ncbi:MAG: dual specificity protein phosphatase family protein [Solobacterium sp.]|nr:dual specificity protein phosphatase family protein [Solobacterium sp.]
MWKISKTADGRQIWIVDLRRESHVLLGRIPVSLYDAHNFGNEGLTLEEIEKDEIERFGSMFGQTISAFTREDDSKVDEVKINVQGILTEKELVESAGLSYLRIPVRDHTWPSPQEVDTFIDFLKGLDSDSIWLHFHCQAGKGRTACYMAMYDKMMNPEISCEDICVRQTRLGGNYILYTEQSDSYKAPLYEEKARMMRLFCRYVEENHDTGYKVSWSQWLKENDK